MIEKVIEISGVDPDRLYTECSIIHQRYGTSEYSGLLGELPCLREIYGSSVFPAMCPAVEAFREARKQFLTLYPTVEETLLELKNKQITIAAFTESKAFYTNYRFRKLGLDNIIDFLYSPRDHSVSTETISGRRYKADVYEFKKTIHRFTPDGEYKPNPHILISIIEELGASIEEVVYVGDHILKDVFMAKEAKVTDVHAAYGVSQHRPEYELLRKVTHWTPEMVEREREALKPGDIHPSFVLHRNLAEILPLFLET